jgi:integral membrane protein
VILRLAPDVLPRRPPAAPTLRWPATPWRAVTCPATARLTKEHRLSSIRTFRYVALAEATSFLALLVATYVKHAQDSSQGVQILGPIHGILFLAYVLIALMVREPARWSTRTTLGVLVAAVLPFGGFVVDRWLARTQPGAA